MLRHLMTVVTLFLCAGAAFADDPMLGTWEDKEKGMKIVFTEADSRMSAKIIKGTATFDFDNYSYQETNGQATINGNFADGKGNSYPFTAEAANGTMTFRTGKTEYHLSKQGVVPATPKADNPLEDKEPGKPEKIEDPAPPAGAGDYRHKSGLWSLTAPGAGWIREESPDGNTTKWSHPNGALVFVTIVPDVPFADPQEFYDKVLKPGLTQSGAQFANQGPMDEPGVPSFIAMFSRNRNNVPEYASCVCSVVNGKGVIFQMSTPQQQKDAMANQMAPIFTSFKLHK